MEEMVVKRLMHKRGGIDQSSGNKSQVTSRTGIAQAPLRLANEVDGDTIDLMML